MVVLYSRDSLDWLELTLSHILVTKKHLLEDTIHMLIQLVLLMVILGTI